MTSVRTNKYPPPASSLGVVPKTLYNVPIHLAFVNSWFSKGEVPLKKTLKKCHTGFIVPNS